VLVIVGTVVGLVAVGAVIAVTMPALLAVVMMVGVFGPVVVLVPLAPGKVRRRKRVDHSYDRNEPGVRVEHCMLCSS
jgi:hypothetical protein